MKLVGPPSCGSLSAIVFIGRDRRGNWVAQEQYGLFGGLFVNRAQAIKYALFENGHHPEAIVELAGKIELDMRRHISVAPTSVASAANAASPHRSTARCAVNNMKESLT